MTNFWQNTMSKYPYTACSIHLPIAKYKDVDGEL